MADRQKAWRCVVTVMTLGRVYLCLSPLFLLPPCSSAQNDSEVKTCTVTQGYKVRGFGGARCCLKFPCSLRLTQFAVHTFLHSRHVACVLDVFSAATYLPTPLLQQLPHTLRPRALWLHLQLLHLDLRDTFHLDLLASGGQQGNATAFEFVSPADLPTEDSEDGGSLKRTFEWRGVKVVSVSGTDVTPAVMSLPQFDVIIRFRPLSLDLLSQNSTLLDETAISIEAPTQARSEDPAYSKGPYASYSVCGTLHDDDRFWGQVRDRGFAETRVQACIRFAVTSHGDPDPSPRPPGLDTGECLQSSVNLAQCERRHRALLSCDPLLHRPLLLRCLHNSITDMHHNLTTTTPTTTTSPNLTTTSPNTTTVANDDYLSFPYRLFRSCLQFICTGNTAFCHLLGWQRGNTSSTTGSGHPGNCTMLFPQGNRSLWQEHGVVREAPMEEGISWACQHLFDLLLQESLCAGCEDVTGGLGTH